MKKIMISSLCAGLLCVNAAQIDYDSWTLPSKIGTSKTFWDSLGAKASAENKAKFDLVSTNLNSLQLSDLQQLSQLYTASKKGIADNEITSDDPDEEMPDFSDITVVNAGLDDLNSFGFGDIVKADASLAHVRTAVLKMNELGDELKKALVSAADGIDENSAWLMSAKLTDVQQLFTDASVDFSALNDKFAKIISDRDSALESGEKAGFLKLFGDESIKTKADLLAKLNAIAGDTEASEQFYAKINPFLQTTMPLEDGQARARRKLLDFLDSVVQVDPEDFTYVNLRDNYIKLTNLKKYMENKALIEATMSAISELAKAGALDITGSEEVKKALEEAKKAEVTVEKATVTEKVEQTLSAETAKVVSKSETVASNIVEAKSTMVEAKNEVKKALEAASVTTVKIEKDIYDGGLAELKEAVKQIEASDNNTSVTNKAQIEELIKKVEIKIQTALNEAAEAVAEEKHAEVSTAALNALNIQINNMNKRLGEIRGLNGEIGAWLRVYGSQNKSETGSKAKTYSTQIGADKKIEFADADLIAGALFGYDRGSFTNGKSNTYSLGAYASYVANEGFFADAVLKYAKVKHKYDGASAKSQNIFLASLEGGYRFDVREQLYIEPSLELITGRISKFELSTSDYTASVKAFTPLIFKPQIFMGASAGDFTLRYGVGAVINAHKANEIDTRLADFTNNGLAGESSLKMKKSNHGFTSVGMAYRVSENLRINFSAEHTFGSKNKGYELNSTIRYTF